ncbi:MAG: type IV pilus biogenesis protein EbsA [Cyanobacteria bacterium P01_A01_bin.135]
MSLKDLKPANDRDVNVYSPYYQGRKRSALPYAITLYQRGNLEGDRQIEGGKSIPFLATWNVSSLPADLTRCLIRFDDNEELSYEITLANFEFVDYLIDVLFNVKSAKITDFSRPFYRRLLRYDD